MPKSTKTDRSLEGLESAPDALVTPPHALVVPCGDRLNAFSRRNASFPKTRQQQLRALLPQHPPHQGEKLQSDLAGSRVRGHRLFPPAATGTVGLTVSGAIVHPTMLLKPFGGRTSRAHHLLKVHRKVGASPYFQNPSAPARKALGR